MMACWTTELGPNLHNFLQDCFALHKNLGDSTVHSKAGRGQECCDAAGETSGRKKKGCGGGAVGGIPSNQESIVQ